MKKLIAGCLLGLGMVSSANAVTLGQSLTPIQNFQLGQSYDGPGFNTFLQFSSIVTPGVFQAGPFTGHANGGSTLSFTSLGGISAFDGHNGIGTNIFGYLDSSHNFNGILDNSIIGSTASTIIGENQEFTLAMQSPVSLFSSVAANNPNGESHIVLLQINQTATLTLNNLAHYDTGPHTFTFEAGGFLALSEDLFHSCGNVPGIGFTCGDVDYNDFAVYITQYANGSPSVPEPASVILGSIGMAAMLRRRRSQTAAE